MTNRVKENEYLHKEQSLDSHTTNASYRYDELSTEAKKVAVTQVHTTESGLYPDFRRDYDQIQEQMNRIFTEAGLIVTGNILWKYTNKAALDFSNVRMTDSFIKQQLTPEEYAIFLGLNEITSCKIEGKLFDEDYKKMGFEFILYDLDYYDFVNKLALQFLVERSTDEEIIVKYKMPYLFVENDENDELIDYDELEDFEKDFSKLALRYLDAFSEKISVPVEKLATTCIKLVNKFESYLGSEDYYKELLEKFFDLVAPYRFNESGIILPEKILPPNEMNN